MVLDGIESVISRNSWRYPEATQVRQAPVLQRTLGQSDQLGEFVLRGESRRDGLRRRILPNRCTREAVSSPLVSG